MKRHNQVEIQIGRLCHSSIEGSESLEVSRAIQVTLAIEELL